MNLVKKFMLLACCILDVRIHAQSVEADHNGFKFTANQTTIVMKKDALMDQREESIQLIRGEFYVETNEQPKFTTPYASFRCKSTCKALITRTYDQVAWRALQGSWEFVRTGEARKYELGAGARVVVSAVQSDGKAHIEPLQGLPWERTISDWAQLYPGKFPEFKSSVAQFREEWMERVKLISNWNEDESKRLLASHERHLADERARRAAIEREDQRLRQMFRQKNYLSP